MVATGGGPAPGVLVGEAGRQLKTRVKAGNVESRCLFSVEGGKREEAGDPSARFSDVIKWEGGDGR